jgi:hypothetical protein
VLLGGLHHGDHVVVDPRLVGTARPRRPVASIRRTVSSMVPEVRWGLDSVARAAQATSHPASARATAVAAPTPRLAPVTRATLPSRSSTMLPLSSVTATALSCVHPCMKRGGPNSMYVRNIMYQATNLATTARRAPGG